MTLSESPGKPHRRITFLAVVLAAITVALTAQLVRWQFWEREVLVALAEQEHTTSLEIPPRRGNIRDRNGHLLAADIFVYDVSAAPNLITDPQGTASRLAPALGRPPEELRELLGNRERLYVQLARGIDQASAEKLAAWELSGISVDPRPKRVYPEGQLAAHLLGFVNDTRIGFYGVEGFYNGLLSGTAGLLQGERAFGQQLPLDASEFAPAQDGSDLILYMDRNLQAMVERELADAVRRNMARRGTIIIMEPESGAILAAASYPAYDPNAFAEADSKLYPDPAVSGQYEPGSVFKIITMAAGLDSGVITPETVIEDNGLIEVGGRPIYNSDRSGHGRVTMTEVLAKSLNVGAAYVSVTLGKERFYNYLRRFGFGRISEIDLSSEGPGSLKTPGDSEWYESDLGTNSFGQGIAVTPIQMISAAAAVANQGKLMKPQVVKEVILGGELAANPRRRVIQSTVVRRAISAETAHTLSEMLTFSTKQETSSVHIAGYSVAGKTGTAQIPIPGGYHPTLTIASFVGWVPAYDPAFVALVIIEEPHTSPWGNIVAAPVFKRVAEQALVLLGVPPEQYSGKSVN
jgi:cell division protein FtsI/penicillin-binding protein 2